MTLASGWQRIFVSVLVSTLVVAPGGVLVAAPPLVETGKSGVSETISSRSIDGLPTASRALERLVFLAPTGEPVPNASAQAYSVDSRGGLATVAPDMVLIEGTGVLVVPKGGIGIGGRIGAGGTILGADGSVVTELPFVQRAALGSEFGADSTSGVINVITRPHPDALFGVGDVSALESNPPVLYEATLGGPIVRDRLWFFGSSASRSGEERPAWAGDGAGSDSPAYDRRLANRWMLRGMTSFSDWEWSDTPTTGATAGTVSATDSSAPLFSWKPSVGGAYSLDTTDGFRVDFRVSGTTGATGGFRLWKYSHAGGPTPVDLVKPLSTSAGDYLLLESPGKRSLFLGFDAYGKPTDTWGVRLGTGYTFTPEPIRFGSIDWDWSPPQLGHSFSPGAADRAQLGARFKIFDDPAAIFGRHDTILGRDGTYIGDEFTVTPSAGASEPLIDFSKVDFSGISVQAGSRVWFPNITWQMYEPAAANDPFLRSKGSWGQPLEDLWALKRIGADWSDPALRRLLPDVPAPVVVAVVDSGIDPAHPDLAGALWTNEGEIPGNGIDDDGNGYVDDRHGWDFLDRTPRPHDDCGHGTVVAGIIAARSGNGTGIAGVNPWTRIMPLKILDHRGRGGNIDAARAIVYAADNGARVINVSLGGRVQTPLEERAVAYAVRRGAIVVAAAGNDGAEVGRISPAGLPGVVTVSSSGPDDARANFSNWGRPIALAAPGLDILSLRASRTDLLVFEQKDYRPGQAFVGEDAGYYRVSGTSFSAPFVSGAASLLIARTPELTAEQVVRILEQSARDIEVPGTDQYSGYGLLDLRAALAADPAFFVAADIAGVQVVREGKEAFLRVDGTADADRLAKAWVEVGRGERPTSWEPASRPFAAAVRGGQLALIPAKRFSGEKVWTIRAVAEHRNGKRREARYKLTVQ